MLKLWYAVAFALFWIIGLGTAFYLNGGTKDLEHPVALLLAGVVLAVTGFGTWALATDDRIWQCVIRPGVEKPSHSTLLRFSAYVLGKSASWRC